MAQDPPFTALPSRLRVAPAVGATRDQERLARSGHRPALEALLREHASAVLRLCHHVAGPADGRDAAQEALERIVTGIARFDPERGAFRPWALTVARNVCRDRLRRRGLERGAFVHDGHERSAAARASAADPEQLALLRDDAEALERALAELPENLRSALVLFHLHEASYEEIAQTLEVPIGTVMTWLHRGRKRLRSAMNAEEER